MAQSNTCDLCGQPAVDTIELKSKTVTNVTKDVCEEHLALFKGVVHLYTNQASKTEFWEMVFPEPKSDVTYMDNSIVVEGNLNTEKDDASS